MKEALLRECLRHIEEYLARRDDVCNAYKVIFPESYVSDVMGEKLLDHYCDLVQTMLNPDSEDISYFLWECEMGKTPMTVTVDEVEFLLDNEDSFITYLKFIGDVE